MAYKLHVQPQQHPTLHAAGVTGVLAAAALMRHACTPPVANLGPLNPYVAAAFEEWGLASSGGGGGGSGKYGLTAVVARQVAAAPSSMASPAAGVRARMLAAAKHMNDCPVNGQEEGLGRLVCSEQHATVVVISGCGAEVASVWLGCPPY